VNAFLLVPKSAGRHPAVLLLHGSGGNREDMLVPAVELATRGAVALTISQPNDAATYRPLVVNARRALDLLVARKDVDDGKLGLIGFSLGAQTAAIVAGDDPRLSAVGVIAGRGNAVTRYWMHRAHEPLYFQAGTHDAQVPHDQLVALIRAAPGRPKVTWYDTGHGMSRRALEDQVAWVARELRLTR
jgi:dienelactone hydrolase